MSALIADSEIRSIVGSAIKRRFPKIHVLAINVHERRDEDDDEVVDVAVVFEAGKNEFDGAKVPELISEVARALGEARDFRFPILSFIAKSELGNRKPEAA